MKPDLPPVSPVKFPPLNFSQLLESRIRLPDGRMLKEVGGDPASLEGYCQCSFGRSWFDIRAEYVESLDARLGLISARITTLEVLLRQGQPAESLITAYDDICEQLDMAYADGSLEALVMMSKLSLVGGRFPPLGTSGKGVEAAVMAAEFGYVSAYHFLGDYHLGEGRAYEAAGAYQKGSERGCIVCSYQLGQFAERGVGGITKSDRAAFNFYADVYLFYPPAAVAIGQLCLRNMTEFSRPANLTLTLEIAVEMQCDGAAVVLAECYLLTQRTSYVKRKVMSLYRCAAVGGDIETQLKLASLLADEGAAEMEIEPDLEEAVWWYERVCCSESATPAQAIQARLGLGHLFMGKEQFDRAAHHFSFASDTDLEAAEIQHICEEKAANQRRCQKYDTGGENR